MGTPPIVVVEGGGGGEGVEDNVKEEGAGGRAEERSPPPLCLPHWLREPACCHPASATGCGSPPATTLPTPGSRCEREGERDKICARERRGWSR